VVDAVLELADRQLLDVHGRRVGKVDDLDLELDEHGVLWVRALHAGPGALGPRLHSVAARAWSRIVARVTPGSDHDATRIPIGVVADIGLQIRLSVPADGLAVERSERTVRTLLVDHLPGADVLPGGGSGGGS
jgi:hypothetical protein